MAKKYKMKTNRSAAKRFSFTANGKIKRKKAGMRHFMRRRSVRAKRNLRNPAVPRVAALSLTGRHGESETGGRRP